MTFYSNVKQKSYVLNPRGKPLYEDANRFGTKMLEKMGWSKGKGLGINEDGEQNFIRVAHKTDQQGMGYQERDDQWTGHENQFNSLLKSLDNSSNVSMDGGGHKEANQATPTIGLGFGTADKNIKKLKSVKLELSGKSLEEMSKNSGVRVHYRKFTRSKDISKYTEKDLANIFGKKCVDGHKIEAEVKQVEPVSDLSQSSYEISTIETGTTIQEYFKKEKNKPSKRRKEKLDKSNEEQVSNVEQSEKKRQKKDKQFKLGMTVPEDVEEHEPSRLKEENKKKKSVPITLERSNAEDSDGEMKPAFKTNPNITMNEVFEINRYHAEMFRFVDLDGFPNANLSDLSGYGYNKEFELKVSEKSKDQNKINDLWDYALINKYGKEVIQTKKAKRYSIKHLKKKNVFMKL
ncbi:PIN2/TERF1-interacting telomerase inhibitor 1-like isoform X2 [Sitodiplosis mosellana]|uniref:PIN2/TERF1-interacting telomerase inhibitor 1-like isoform X2 n=1 Tax=Sitodiplosis mosellana TaxID=263140 RepID=UPI0024449065|nr:PIN2/TERF1-interacting telomerase inhibitor 1-like isoform X2 [Sitodiplosis mosellana]